MQTLTAQDASSFRHDTAPPTRTILLSTNSTSAALYPDANYSITKVIRGGAQNNAECAPLLSKAIEPNASAFD